MTAPPAGRVPSVRGVDVWLAGDRTHVVAGRLLAGGLLLAWFAFLITLLAAITIAKVVTWPTIWSGVQMIAGSLSRQTDWVLPLFFGLILSAYASIYALGVVVADAAPRRERDVAVRFAQAVAAVSVAFAVGEVASFRSVGTDLVPVVVTVFASAGCVVLAANLTRFFVGDLAGRIKVLESFGEQRRAHVRHLRSTASRSAGQRVSALANVALPCLIVVVLSLFADVEVGARFLVAVLGCSVVVVSALTAVVFTWPHLHESWSARSGRTEMVTAIGLPLLVPFVIALTVTPAIIRFGRTGSVPLEVRAIFVSALVSAVVFSFLVAGSAAFPWERFGSTQGLCPYTLRGVASAFARWSVSRSEAATRKDLISARASLAADRQPGSIGRRAGRSNKTVNRAGRTRRRIAGGR